MIKDYLLIALTTAVIGLSMWTIKLNNKINSIESQLIEVEKVTIASDSTVLADLTSLELNKDNFYLACAVMDIHHPEIVYAQAKLESGNFTSHVYNTKNNFLGLYNSRKKTYYEFDHWTSCLQGYKDYVQVKCKNDDYYQFLKDLPYAADPNYIGKVKNIVSKL